MTWRETLRLDNSFIKQHDNSDDGEGSFTPLKHHELNSSRVIHTAEASELNSPVKCRFLQTFSTSSSITSSWQSENVKEDGAQTLQMTEPRNPEPLPSSRTRLHMAHTWTRLHTAHTWTRLHMAHMDTSTYGGTHMDTSTHGTHMDSSTHGTHMDTICYLTCNTYNAMQVGQTNKWCDSLLWWFSFKTHHFSTHECNMYGCECVCLYVYLYGWMKYVVCGC